LEISRLDSRLIWSGCIRTAPNDDFWVTSSCVSLRAVTAAPIPQTAGRNTVGYNENGFKGANSALSSLFIYFNFISIIIQIIVLKAWIMLHNDSVLYGLSSVGPGVREREWSVVEWSSESCAKVVSRFSSQRHVRAGCPS
jgi:hypothetical protein